MTETKYRKVEITPTPLESLPAPVYQYATLPFLTDAELSSVSATSKRHQKLTTQELKNRENRDQGRNLTEMKNIFRVLEFHVQHPFQGHVSQDLCKRYLALYFKHDYSDQPNVLGDFIRMIQRYFVIFDQDIFIQNANARDWNTAIQATHWDIFSGDKIEDILKVLSGDQTSLSAAEKINIVWKNYRFWLPALIMSWQNWEDVQQFSKYWTKDQRKQANNDLDELYEKSRYETFFGAQVADKAKMAF